MRVQSMPSQVHSHWNHLFEDFQTSPLEFYRSVEEAIARRQVPNTSRSRVKWHEGGALSAEREYLRVTRGKLNFDIGAAPFGTGFFFSSWLVGPKTHGLRYLIALLVILILVAAASVKLLGVALGLIMLIVLIPAALLLLGDSVRKGRLGTEESVLAIPLLGSIYEAIFLPDTYYKLDTESMFQTAVHASVMEALHGITKAKGIRPLTELEQRPVLQRIASEPALRV